ncbi:hypothetical protein QR680_005016 [Steinernema hermaphroditum]|uniref:Uncharacterized protein n=1 Tax=Steinernema hermaphroditum TaxID=289476 RepID=A0AA39HS03_9BILA|nr:hypothetical protein QR680_005016 [Steinernema hermaphroditum]
MDALPPELVAPILHYTTKESLQNLGQLDFSWSPSVEAVLSTRCDILLQVAYAANSKTLHYYIRKHYLDGSKKPWCPSEGDRVDIEMFFFIVTSINSVKSLENFLEHPREFGYAEVAKTLKFITSSRSVFCCLFELDVHPEDLLDLLPKDGPIRNVYQSSVTSRVISPLELPIRLNLSPLPNVNQETVRQLRSLRGLRLIRALIAFHESHPSLSWDFVVSIPLEQSYHGLKTVDLREYRWRDSDRQFEVSSGGKYKLVVRYKDSPRHVQMYVNPNEKSWTTRVPLIGAALLIFIVTFAVIFRLRESTVF